EATKSATAETIDPIRKVIRRDCDPISFRYFRDLLGFAGNCADDHVVFEASVLNPDVLGLTGGNAGDGCLDQSTLDLRNHAACVLVQSASKLRQSLPRFIHR